MSACSYCSQSATSLTDEVNRMSSLSAGLTNCKGTYDAIEGIMNGTMKVTYCCVPILCFKASNHTP